MTNIAFVALCVVLYTYLGYPMLVAALARLRRWRPVPQPSYTPSVSVCMAVHNGAKYVERKLESLQALDYPRDHIEFLVFCDGCTDDTAAMVSRLAQDDPRIRLLDSEVRRGKPAALNALHGIATGEVLLMTDVRPPLSHDAVRALVAMLADPSVACVSGNLELRGATGAGAYWTYEKFIRSAEADFGGLVGVSGTLYAIRRADFPKLPEDVILDDMWVPLTSALRTRRRIAFCDRAKAYDDAFEDDREFVRKARTLAGNYQLVARMPHLLVPLASPVWFQLLSHKLLRLLCPWALIALFLVSWSVVMAPGGEDIDDDPPRFFWWVLTLGQTLFYGMALLGQRAGKLAALARTFVVLNLAALVGLWRYARGTQQITW
jgi:cellulose synthase/poly-beta-1,6-N-acetylglucosamine synthase-like glycosyltransferase